VPVRKIFNCPFLIRKCKFLFHWYSFFISKNRIDEIRRNLTVNVSNLSSRIRKLTSAEDKRVSAVSIGYVGVGILVVIFSAIVFIDSSLLHKDMTKLLDNIKNAACCKKKDTLIKWCIPGALCKDLLSLYTVIGQNKLTWHCDHTINMFKLIYILI
jgi:hypothetical protein